MLFTKTLEIKFAPRPALVYKGHTGGLMPARDKTQEIRMLHETMYEQSLVFLALRTHPDGDERLAETRELIMRIYNQLQTLV